MSKLETDKFRPSLSLTMCDMHKNNLTKFLGSNDVTLWLHNLFYTNLYFDTKAKDVVLSLNLYTK